MTSTVCFANCNLKLSKENLISLLGVYYSVSYTKDWEDEFTLYQQDKFKGSDWYELIFKCSNPDTYRFILSFAKHYANEINDFFGYVDNTDSDEDEVRFYYRDGHYYSCYNAATTENIVDFSTFKKIISERDDNVTFESTDEDITFIKLKEALRNADNELEFKSSMMKLLDKEIDFNDKEFNFSAWDKIEESSIDEEFSAAIYNEDEELQFHVVFSQKLFLEKDFLKTDHDANNYPELFASIQSSAKMPVQIEFNDGEEAIEGIVPLFLATHLFNLEDDPFGVKIKLNKDWVDPCTSCDKRLRKEISGCQICEFESSCYSMVSN